MGMARQCVHGTARDHAEFANHSVERPMALQFERIFPKENRHIRNDQKVIDEWSRKSWLIVPKRNHFICNLLLWNWMSNAAVPAVSRLDYQLQITRLQIL